MKPRILRGDGTWSFTATIDGDDMVVRGVLASWFEDRETASGISAAASGAMGCALPMAIPGFRPTAGSPIPKMPWETMVRVWNPETKKQIVVPLIDVGPGRIGVRAIDLTPAAFEALGVYMVAGLQEVDYRVIGGAKFAGP